MYQKPGYGISIRTCLQYHLVARYERVEGNLDDVLRGGEHIYIAEGIELIKVDPGDSCISSSSQLTQGSRFSSGRTKPPRIAYAPLKGASPGGA